MSTYSHNFLCLPPEYTDPSTAAVAVLPVPYDATTSCRTGTREGPDAVIRASQDLELFDLELGGEFHRCGVTTLDPVEPDARGPEFMHERIHAAAAELVDAGKFLLALGVEHGITAPLVRAVKARHENLSVLQIDAHPDLHDRYQGSPHSHACVMRRVHELGCPIAAVGIRAVSREEDEFRRATGLRFTTARQCREDAGWIERVVADLTDAVYVTVDIDGFDPAFAPGTGTPEPGGLDWYQVVDLLRAVAQRRRIVGGDVVEVLPVPGQWITETLAARVGYKLICHGCGSVGR